jgi:hypothetical protein
MEFVNPFPEPLWRRRKVARSVWRKTIVGKRRTRHGGRGKIYGLKSGKQRKHKKSAQ